MSELEWDNADPPDDFEDDLIGLNPSDVHLYKFIQSHEVLPKENSIVFAFLGTQIEQQITDWFSEDWRKKIGMPATHQVLIKALDENGTRYARCGVSAVHSYDESEWTPYMQIYLALDADDENGLTFLRLYLPSDGSLDALGVWRDGKSVPLSVANAPMSAERGTPMQRLREALAQGKE